MSACPLALARPAWAVARLTADEAAGARGPDAGPSHPIATAHAAHISEIALRLLDIVASVDRVRLQVAPWSQTRARAMISSMRVRYFSASESEPTIAVSEAASMAVMRPSGRSVRVSG